MRQPRGDNRGILHPARLRRHVRFRRHLPAPALRRHVEHYWLVDWDLSEPFAQHVVPHPAVNVVFQRDGAGPTRAEVSGVGLELFTITLTGVGTVSGVQFRPGGFRPFWPGSVAELTGRRLSFAVLADRWPPANAALAGSAGAGAGPPPADPCVGTDTERCQALDALLADARPAADPVNDEVVGLVEAIRFDRSVLRVDDFARRHGQSVRRLQRLFLTHVGVGPKWVIRRYRLHEAIERAAGDPPDWATLAADLGYSDQAHLVRDFTAVAGVPPTSYTRAHT
ncbi:helix-turn-helix domain-containing protein [Micromonospora endolithica]|uniref:AraC family transcriptional regulator n=1 Tax=Micromonospora endolithica TaxID=230091 RepID=A0A3A9ZKB8_9ACTN|nr:AraC family transcriptional regulator [Micromonospora endolithica]RKN48324.1 AraC family transcriptional regulator [Micromonospora endolithica]TWJ24616.1 helix-turn-helix protein [Micromonospora endolithica]